MGSTSRKCEVRGRVEGNQFRLLGVPVQLLEEAKKSQVAGRSCVAFELRPLKSWFSLQ